VVHVLNIESSLAKLAHAERHLRGLEVAVSEQRDMRSNSIHTTPGQVTSLTALKAASSDGPDAAFLGLLVGDVLSNLRSALDHLAHSVARSRGRGNRIRNFPIYDSLVEFRSKTAYWLAMPELPIVESLQPFRSPNIASHPLRILNRLRNLDTHQDLHMVVHYNALVIEDIDSATGEVGPARRHIYNEGDTFSLHPQDHVSRVSLSSDFYVDLSNISPVHRRFLLLGARLRRGVALPDPGQKLDDQMALHVSETPAVNVLTRLVEHVRRVVLPALAARDSLDGPTCSLSELMG
jgi:hypothetical protein